MTSERWSRVADVLESAIILEPAHRAAFLEKECAGEDSLRAEVECFLVHQQRMAHFLEAPALEMAATVSEPRERLPDGLRVGPYQICAFLGSGGMGEVYRATDTRLGRDVALKFLPPELTQDPKALERFTREARAASALDHANICTLHDIGEYETQPYLVMELLEGQSLSERIAAAPLPACEVLDLSLQIISALAAAHAKGIVHRDIKPANIFVTTDGHAKVLDFGLAKLLAEPRQPAEAFSETEKMSVSTGTEELSQPGVTMGTVAYMSPEQVLGEDVDARTDLFSLGVTMYEMATGRAPFLDTAPRLTAQAILHRDPVAPKQANPTLPPQLDRIILKALSKNRETRYQSAIEFRQELERLRERSAQTRLADRRLALVFALVVLAAGLATFFWLRLRQTGLIARGARSPEFESIAVLPLVNASGDASLDYLGEGISDNIIRSLSRLSGLKVRSYSSAAALGGRKADPNEIGRRLQVQLLLTGRVIQRGDQLSVSVELVDTRDNSQVWGEQYNRKFADIFSVQEQLGREIAARMRLRLNNEQSRSLARQSTLDAEAYREYLKGRYSWSRRTGESLRSAIQHFENAITRDPDFALAYAGLADCYVLLSAYSPVPLREHYPKARVAALKAIELDDTLGEARTALALVKENLEWDWVGAEREYRQAIELNPGYATAHHWFATLLLALGRRDEALAEIKQAQDLDPLDLSINSVHGWILHDSRRHDEAIEQLRRTLALDPHFAHARTELGKVYLQKAMYQEAIGEFETALALGAAAPRIQARLAYAHAVSGHSAQAQTMLEQMLARSRNSYFPALEIAIVYLGMGNRDRAFEWLRKALDERCIYLTWLNSDPLYDPVRSDSRFLDLLRRMHLTP